jgi:hypothetical protein
MKKLAIGCAVILALAMVGVGVASYAAYRKVSSAFAGFAELGSLPELERSIRNQRPFAPPANGEPNRAQIEHLVEVQGTVRMRLGARAEEMDRRYKRLLAKDRATAVDAPEIISAYRDLAAAYMDAKRAQVDALNRAGLSIEEYRWTRSQVYAALGMPLMDLDIARILEDVKEGREVGAPAFRMTGPASGSPALQPMVEPHRKALEANVGLAFFGL